MAEAGRMYSTGQTAIINNGPKKGMLVAVLARKLKTDTFIVGPVRGGDTFTVPATDLTPTGSA